MDSFNGALDYGRVCNLYDLFKISFHPAVVETLQQWRNCAVHNEINEHMAGRIAQ